MNQEKVSIIIPVYNVEPYLAECLESAVGQDYGNVEIVAINDGSTDASLVILKDFSAKHPNIIIINIENQGQSVARNTGLEIATGEYILFLDSDDFIEKNTLSLCMEKIKFHQVDIVFFAANTFCDGVDASLAKNLSYERSIALQNKTLSAKLFFAQAVNLKNYIVSPCLYIYKKSKLSNIKFYPGVVHEDNLFTTKLLLENKDIQVTCIPDKLFNRRLRPESTMTQKKQEKHIQGYMTVAEELFKLDVVREKSEAGIALNKFIQNIVVSAVSTCRITYGNRIPFDVRKKSLQLMARIRIKFLIFKCVAVCVLPELLIAKEAVKNILRVIK
ncbi:MAG: glycosyltransferase family 2 protein [Pseudomonas sp.]